MVRNDAEPIRCSIYRWQVSVFCPDFAVIAQDPHPFCLYSGRFYALSSWQRTVARTEPKSSFDYDIIADPARS